MLLQENLECTLKFFNRSGHRWLVLMTPAIIYVLILYLCTVLLIIASGAMLRYRKSPGSLYFIGLCITTAFYTFGYSFEVISPNLEQALFWSRIQYIGLPFLPTFLLLFVAAFVSIDRSVPRILEIFSFFISAAILIMRQSNHRHSLFYSNEFLIFKDSFSMLQFDTGPFYLVTRSYNAFAMIFSIALAVAYIGRVPALFRKQAHIILVGLLVSMVPYTVYYTFFMSRLGYSGLDLMPLGLVLGTPFFLFALLKKNPYRLAPVGRDRVVESMSDAVIVLDRSGRIVDANPSAL